MREKSTRRRMVVSAFSVTSMMLVFKIIGFAKQAVIAYFFGADFAMDIYFLAYGFVMGIGEAVVQSVSVSVVAVYSSLMVTSGKEKANELISELLEIILPLCLIFVVVLCLISSPVARIIAPAYRADHLQLLQKYIFWMAPVLLFSMFELVLGAVMDSNKQFYISRMQSFLNSICIIILSFTVSKILGIRVLIAGQYLASVCFTILLIYSIRKYYSFRIKKIYISRELREVLITAVPLFIGNSALQINQIVDRGIASSLSEGAASSLSYCHTLEQFVTNIMIVNIGNVLFAYFAEDAAKNDRNTIKKSLSFMINLLISLLIPISIITVVCSEDIVKIVYYRGAFSYDAVILTSMALIGYAVSFPFVGFRDLIIKGFYAFKDTKDPMIASLCSIICNIILSVLLSRKIGILGISLATSISAMVGSLINALFFRKQIPSYPYQQHIFTVARLMPGSIALIFLSLWLKSVIHFSALINFLLIAFTGFCVYFFFGWLCKVEPVCYIGNHGLIKQIRLRYK